MLLVKPIGKAKGVGFLSVYVPIIGCITEAIIFKVKVINPNRVNERLSDILKMGNITGMTACKESFNKCDALIIKSMRSEERRVGKERVYEERAEDERRRDT